MEIDHLHRISFIFILTGLVIIYASSVVFEPENVSVGDVDESLIGDTVRVEARAGEVRKSENAVFIDMEGDETVLSGVYFGNEDLGVEEGETYVFEGVVDVYRGELELVVEGVVE